MCLARTLAHSLSEITAFCGIAETPLRIDAPPTASAPRITARRSRPFTSSLGSDIEVTPEQNYFGPWNLIPQSPPVKAEMRSCILPTFKMVIGDHLRGSDFTTHVGDQRILKCPLQYSNLIGVQLNVTNLSYSLG
jgi:hypothetical protein